MFKWIGCLEFVNRGNIVVALARPLNLIAKACIYYDLFWFIIAATDVGDLGSWVRLP